MSKNPTPAKEFFKISTQEGADEATILLYGFIGEEWTWDSEDGWKIGGVTDLDFVAEFNRLSEQYKRIHIRLNSYGGDFRHGNAIMTAIANSKAEVHTWNDGIAASMAADIFLCGHRRHMAKNALLMIHPTWTFCMGHAETMRECADTLDKMTTAAIIATAASVGITEEDMRSRYYSDYKDHWLTYADAAQDDLITEESDNSYQSGTPTNKLAGMTYKQLVEFFEAQDATTGAEPSGWLSAIGKRIERAFNKLAAPAGPTAQTTTDMTLDDFKKSIADGSLTLDAVKAHLAELDAAAEPTPAAPAQDLTPILKELADLKASLADAQKRLDEYGAAPGASKSTPGMPGSDPATEPTTNALDQYNKAMAEAAQKGEVLFRPNV